MANPKPHTNINTHTHTHTNTHTQTLNEDRLHVLQKAWHSKDAQSELVLVSSKINMLALTFDRRSKPDNEPTKVHDRQQRTEKLYSLLSAKS